MIETLALTVLLLAVNLVSSHIEAKLILLQREHFIKVGYWGTAGKRNLTNRAIMYRIMVITGVYYNLSNE